MGSSSRIREGIEAKAHGDLQQAPVGKGQVRRLDVPLGGQLDELEGLQGPLLGTPAMVLAP